MKKLKEISSFLSREEMKNIYGGVSDADAPLPSGGGGAGKCRNAYPEQPAGCYCNRDNECKSKSCPAGGGGTWFRGKCA